MPIHPIKELLLLSDNPADLNYCFIDHLTELILTPTVGDKPLVDKLPNTLATINRGFLRSLLLTLGEGEGLAMNAFA